MAKYIVTDTEIESKLEEVFGFKVYSENVNLNEKKYESLFFYFKDSIVPQDIVIYDETLYINLISKHENTDVFEIIECLESLKLFVKNISYNTAKVSKTNNFVYITSFEVIRKIKRKRKL